MELAVVIILQYMCVYQVIMLYTLNSVMCQLFLTSVVREDTLFKKNKIGHELITVK